jgi:hypothetical protein
MPQIQHQRHWLALLAALLLLMQSFAIWHDAEHAFHTVEEQCERFEAFGHSPTLDLVNSLTPEFKNHTPVVQATSTLTFLPSRLREAYAIRAPPSFS